MKKILFVEDDKLAVRAYLNKLQAAGFQVEVASDGQAALDMIGSIKPDLVLLDLMLPKLSGVEVLREIRAQPAFQTLPILALSFTLDSSMLREAREAGATRVLSKATQTPKEIVEAIRTALAASDAPAQSKPSG